MTRHDEKARELCGSTCEVGTWGAPECERCDAIAQALREEHDRTRRETVEECAGVLIGRAGKARAERDQYARQGDLTIAERCQARAHALEAAAAKLRALNRR